MGTCVAQGHKERQTCMHTLFWGWMEKRVCEAFNLTEGHPWVILLKSTLGYFSRWHTCTGCLRTRLTGQCLMPRNWFYWPALPAGCQCWFEAWQLRLTTTAVLPGLLLWIVMIGVSHIARCERCNCFLAVITRIKLSRLICTTMSTIPSSFSESTLLRPAQTQSQYITVILDPWLEFDFDTFLFCSLSTREPWALWRRSRITWYHEDKPAGPALPAAEWVDPTGGRGGRGGWGHLEGRPGCAIRDSLVTRLRIKISGACLYLTNQYLAEKRTNITNIFTGITTNNLSFNRNKNHTWFTNVYFEESVSNTRYFKQAFG